MLAKYKTSLQRFSPKFWILVLTTFIDRVGGTMIFPFLTLYITKKFDVGMTEAGIVLGLFSISGFVGSMLGGALTDKFGRKGMVLFGLVFSALSSVTMGLVQQISVFYTLAIGVGILSDIAGPARQAMVADLLPEEQRTEGFGIMRVSGNLAWIIGPTVGGFLAGYSYFYLFVIDAITSLIVAVIVLRMIPETKPEKAEGEEEAGIGKTLAGYFQVAKDGIFVAFIVTSIFMGLAYGQIYSTLSVFLRDIHGIPERGYGFMMSANASLVVLMQFWVTARIRKRPPMLMMMLGNTFYMIGLVAYGIFSDYWMFLAAMLVITVGEMIVMPVGQALIAQLAPEHMRGRYMAFASLRWILPSAIGPTAAGLIMDNLNPNWVWYACGISCVIALVGYMIIHVNAQERLEVKPGTT